MDVAAELQARLSHLERQCRALELRQTEFFSRRVAGIGHHQQVRIVKTLAEVDVTPTYPVQGVGGGNTFPIVFVDGDFLDEAGRQTADYVAHRTTRQTFVHAITNNWIPPGTKLQAWQDRGSDPAYPGEWWTDWRDGIRFGKATTAIALDGQGTVREYSPNNYSTEPDSGHDWVVRNRVRDPEIAAGTWLFFCQIDSVAYALSGRCDAEYYYGY